MKPQAYLLSLVMAALLPVAHAQPGHNVPDYPLHHTPPRFDHRSLLGNERPRANTASIKFSDPTQPGTLKLDFLWAEIRITGTNGDDVRVTSSLDYKKDGAEFSDGFRRLDETTSVELKEHNNIISLAMSNDPRWESRIAEFNIQVPRSTRLYIRTRLGGDITVRNIDGEIDINSMNGEVVLTDIGNAAVVNTMNGEVTATFTKSPEKPVSITTMNGEIDLRLPADTKANLRMRTHNGSIRTNFPEGVLEAKTEKTGKAYSYSFGTGETAAQARELAREARELAREHARLARETARQAQTAAKADEDDDPAVAPAAPVAPVPPLPGFGGKTITGTLNGGGVDISLSSMNGTITLRQAK